MARRAEISGKANSSLASAIALHLTNAAAPAAGHSTSEASGLMNEAEIIARLDLILAKLERPPANQIKRVVEHSVSWVKLEKYVELTGDSVDAVMGRRKLGKWLDGQQCKMVDGRVWVNLKAVEKWADQWGKTQPAGRS